MTVYSKMVVKDGPPLMILLYIFPTSFIIVIAIILCCSSENANAQLTVSIIYQGSKLSSIKMMNSFLASPDFLSSSKSASLQWWAVAYRLSSCGDASGRACSSKLPLRFDHRSDPLISRAARRRGVSRSSPGIRPEPRNGWLWTPSNSNRSLRWNPC